MRNDLLVCIKNTQRICTKDVEKLCTNGKYILPKDDAYTYWRSAEYKRRSYKQWDDVPLGYDEAPDDCLHHEYESYVTGTSKRLAPKCVEWLSKTERQYTKLYKREKGNDKREAFVIFSTIFATTVSGLVGYMVGLFLKERDNDLFSYHNRGENKKILVWFSVAISIPFLVILWASPRLLLLMMVAFGIGRGVQYYVQRRQDNEYSSLPMGSDSGLVFAAIPVQLE